MFDGSDFSWEATGNVKPCRLMKVDTAGDNKTAHAGAGELTIGCSGWGSKNAPGTPADDGYLATAGLTVPIVGHGIGYVQCAEAIARGNEIKAGTEGCATNANATANSTQPIAGTALASGSANDIIPYRINPYWKTLP